MSTVPRNNHTLRVKPLTKLSLPPAHGRFGAVRKHDVHTGIDLYAPVGTPVYAIEPGVVVAVEHFTGPKAGSPWWLDTEAVLVEGTSGVILYGEIAPTVRLGCLVAPGEQVGYVTRVLRHDKGLPTSMLHLEAYTTGTRQSTTWPLNTSKPHNLMDPTYLIAEHV